MCSEYKGHRDKINTGEGQQVGSSRGRRYGQKLYPMSQGCAVVYIRQEQIRGGEGGH